MPPRGGWLAALILLTACDEARLQAPSASVTMKLPPARPADARPGFGEILDEVPQAAEAAVS